jgi:hypothetical protein
VLALLAGRELAEHESPSEATLHVLHGHVRLTVGDEAWDGKAGDYVAIPPQRHALQAVEDSVVMLTVLKSLPRPSQHRVAAASLQAALGSCGCARNGVGGLEVLGTEPGLLLPKGRCPKYQRNVRQGAARNNVVDDTSLAGTQRYSPAAGRYATAAELTSTPTTSNIATPRG